MRKIILVMAMSGVLIPTVYCQNGEVLIDVVNAFEEKYPGAKDVEWEYDNEEGVFEVEYTIGKSEYETSYSDAGEWLETEKEIKYSKLPKPVRMAFEKEYAGYAVEEVELVETPEGEFFEIEVAKAGEESVWELYFSADGELVKKEEESGDAEEEDE